MRRKLWGQGECLVKKDGMNFSNGGDGYDGLIITHVHNSVDNVGMGCFKYFRNDTTERYSKMYSVQVPDPFRKSIQNCRINWYLVSLKSLRDNIDSYRPSFGVTLWTISLVGV